MTRFLTACHAFWVILKGGSVLHNIKVDMDNKSISTTNNIYLSNSQIKSGNWNFDF